MYQKDLHCYLAFLLRILHLVNLKRTGHLSGLRFQLFLKIKLTFCFYKLKHKTTLSDNLNQTTFVSGVSMFCNFIIGAIYQIHESNLQFNEANKINSNRIEPYTPNFQSFSKTMRLHQHMFHNDNDLRLVFFAPPHLVCTSTPVMSMASDPLFLFILQCAEQMESDVQDDNLERITCFPLA